MGELILEAADVVAMWMRKHHEIDIGGVYTQSYHVAQERRLFFTFPVEPEIEEDRGVICLDQVGNAAFRFQVVLSRIPIYQWQYFERSDRRQHESCSIISETTNAIIKAGSSSAIARVARLRRVQTRRTLRARSQRGQDEQ